MHTHGHTNGRAKAGIFPFPVYENESTQVVAPQHPEDGHVAIALIGEKAVRVMRDAVLGSYVEPSYRMHIPQIRVS